MSNNFADQSSGGDGPLLFGLLLNNRNNNNGNMPLGENYTTPDTLNPKHIGLELSSLTNDDGEIGESSVPLKSSLPSNANDHSSGDTFTEAIPDVLEMKSHLLQLHSPVIYGGNMHGAALLGHNFVHLAVTTKSAIDNFSHQTLDRSPMTGNATLQPEHESSVSKSHVASDDSKIGRLSDEQLQSWRDNGYLVIPNALSGAQKDLLLKTVHDAAETLAGGGERVQKHSYLPGQEFYVHPCGRAIATLTDYAFQPNIDPLKRIQRIGCGIHRTIPEFRKTILTPFHSTLAKSLGYKDPRIIQSLIIVKAAEIGARVIPHQDGCSGFTNPSSCTTFWYALEDCTVENGCLAVAPGSHRTQPITRRCRGDASGRPEFVDLEEPVFAEIEGVSDMSLPRRNEAGELEYRKLEVQAGTLVLMHGNLMHTSDANGSSKSRVAFNFGVVEGEHDWLGDNYLQPYEGETEFEKL
ncbi:hypothetical protein SBOR_2646 [Sclerotinia borealis F-4128]|uniref:Phytanoyl-CoA dioxygenase family protein n=1 Tax=Sclerotinia borealis (strain F-4128) TaxID=1432307 RepID=W9CQT1_SCLBF|nr:hypothetical protein SBOR_2646 [Sclerotinia borealis F-4128]